MKSWTTADMPSQVGRLAIVTGSNGGLGYETALALAGAGAETIVATRNPDRGNAAVGRILKAFPAAQVRFEQLDLARLDSVAAFADRMLAQGQPVDLLINNAAVMQLPKHEKTIDGFEMQFGTNFLGHFALTAHLLPLLRRSSASRVTNLSSLAHRGGKIDFDDLQGDRKYGPWKAYCQSKLAMLMFSLEMQRRSDRFGWNVLCNAAHPGFARTDLITNGPGSDSFLAKFALPVFSLLSHSAAAGALPTLFAATSPDAKPAGFYGPNGFYEMKGPVSPSFISARAKDEAVAARLWSVAEQLTAVAYPTTEAALAMV